MPHVLFDVHTFQVWVISQVVSTHYVARSPSLLANGHLFNDDLARLSLHAQLVLMIVV